MAQISRVLKLLINVVIFGIVVPVVHSYGGDGKISVREDKTRQE